MTYRLAFPVLALLVAGGCSAKDATAPMSSTVASPATRPALVGSLSERGGSVSDRTFHFTTINIRGAVATQAFGINARGDIVGEYVDGTSRSHGYVIRDGDTTTIDYPGAVFTHASAIGPGGDIVGFYRNAGEPAVNSHGFMRTNKGAFVAVDDPGHINTVAEHILPDGTILGCRRDYRQHKWLDCGARRERLDGEWRHAGPSTRRGVVLPRYGSADSPRGVPDR